MSLSAATEAIALIHEFAEPVPRPLRTRFLERVSALLRDDEILAPARIMEVCRRVRVELLVAAPADVDEPRPAPTPRSPYHRRRA